MRKIEIDKLILDQDIYPRIKTGWLTAYQYAQAMKAGSIFPPVVVGLFEGKHYLIDGWHRLEALRLLGEKHVKAVIKPFESKEKMFIESVKLNTTHGRQLSVQEKVRIIEKLKGFKLTMKQISEIVKVPIDKIERFTIRTVTGPNGKPLFLKSILAKAHVMTESDPTKTDQSSLSVRSISELLGQLIVLLEGDMLPLENEVIKEEVIKLYDLLAEKLQLKALQ